MLHVQQRTMIKTLVFGYHHSFGFLTLFAYLMGNKLTECQSLSRLTLTAFVFQFVFTLLK